jgi:hypothetical protein
MRALILLLFFGISIGLSGCATPAKKVVKQVDPVTHIAPRSVEVPKAIASAGQHVSSASTSAATATATLARAEAIVNGLAFSDEVGQLKLEIGKLKASLSEITMELIGVKSNLDLATKANDRFQGLVDGLNRNLNEVEVDKATLTNKLAQAKADLVTANGEISHLKHQVTWLKLKGWLSIGGVLLACVGLVVAAFVFKLIGTGARFAPLAL